MRQAYDCWQDQPDIVCIDKNASRRSTTEKGSSTEDSFDLQSSALTRPISQRKDHIPQPVCQLQNLTHKRERRHTKPSPCDFLISSSLPSTQIQSVSHHIKPPGFGHVSLSTIQMIQVLQNHHIQHHSSNGSEDATVMQNFVVYSLVVLNHTLSHFLMTFRPVIINNGALPREKLSSNMCTTFQLLTPSQGTQLSFITGIFILVRLLIMRPPSSDLALRAFSHAPVP